MYDCSSVVRDACKPHAVVREHVHIVLGVLAELRAPGILQPRLEPREDRRALELLRRAGVAMRKRNIRRGARFDRERQPHQFRFHGIEARGLRVERHERGGRNFR